MCCCCSRKGLRAGAVCPLLPSEHKNQLLSSCSFDPCENGRKTKTPWRTSEVTPCSALSNSRLHPSTQGFCPDFLALPTFCFSQLLSFLKPFTMDNVVPLSYFNKFVFTCSPSWGVTVAIAQGMNTFLNCSWQGGMVLPQWYRQVVGMKSETKAE